MGARTLNEQILDVLDLALRPLSAADIRRRVPGSVEAGEVSSRLTKMKTQGKVVAVEMPSQAITGPRTIKGWVSKTNPMTLEYIPAIAQTQQIDEGSFRQVASIENTDAKAA